MKPKKFLIIIRDDTQSRVERANLQFDLTRERLHYSRTAVFAIYSNLHTSSANFRVFILPAKNRHTTVSCAFSNYIFQNIKDEFDFTYFLCICFSLWSYYNFEMIWHIMASSRCTMQHECIIALSSSSENESRNYFAPVDPRKSSWLLGRITRQEKKSHAKFRSEFQLYAITQGDQHIF